MLVHAAGTGASAGAAGVSESDMSVVLGGVVGACPVL